ncbi:MAG: hypothetical protein NVS9B4_08310 [Candidatus Acidiferrum sp.]
MGPWSQPRTTYELGFVLACLACIACVSLSACGGGGGPASVNVLTPPPSPADFVLSISPNSLSLTQGSAIAGPNLSVSAQNGFSSAVQITLTGLPTGVSANPSGPISLSPGGAASLIFGAASNAATGNFTISAQGTSGSLAHSATVMLTVQSAVPSNLPRTTFVRTDSILASDSPPGDVPPRHIAYDAANKRVFVANRAMNRVEIFSSATATAVSQLPIPGASSADLSADGSTVWIGTALEQIVAVDASSLRLKSRYSPAPLLTVPGKVFNRPLEVLGLSNGKCFVRLRDAASSLTLLALWDPTRNSLANLTSSAPQLFQNGPGPMARAIDHRHVIVAAHDSSGKIAVLDNNGALVAGPTTLGTGVIYSVSSNPDGTRFAATLTSGGSTQLILLDAVLNQISFYASTSIHGIVFSRDGKYLFACESSSGSPVLTILDGHDLHLVGQAADPAISGISSQIEDVDETQLLFGIANRGVAFIDASSPAALASPAPSFASAPSSEPSAGPLTGGTKITLQGQNFPATATVKFGGQLGGSVTVSGTTQIQATAPASIATGANNVAAYFSNNWLALAPDAFSYGPQILRVLPNAVASVGGDTVQIFGYGFGSDPSKLTVMIGASPATVQQIDSMPVFASSLGLGDNYPFPIQRITLQTPAGIPGLADVFLTAPSGATTAARALQYLQSVQIFSKPGLYKFLVYDQSRQRVYLSSIDHVDVVDLRTGVFLAPIQPPGGASIFAGLRGLTLTPDASQLIIADFGAQNVYLMNPDRGTGTSVRVGGVVGFSSSGPARVAATSTQAVFIALSGEGGSSPSCSSCLAEMNLAASPLAVHAAPQPEVSSVTGSPLLQSSASGDRIFLAFSATPRGPLAIWNASSPNQFIVSNAGVTTTDLAVSGDGAVFAIAANGTVEIRGSDLVLSATPAAPELAALPNRVMVPGAALHPSGALLYQPFLTAAPGSPGVRGGVDILDAHSGILRMRLFLPQQLMTDVDGLHGNFLAVDENGQRLFAITSSDGTPQNAALSVIALASVPLGIGTISPATAPAAGGTLLTIRGSGFQPGLIVTIGGKSASATVKDLNTLTLIAPALTTGAQQIVVTNPSGESSALDAAFFAN